MTNGPRLNPAAAAVEQETRELLAVLAMFQQELGCMVEIAQEKLDAIRGADAGRLEQCTAREADGLAVLRDLAVRRDAILTRLAHELHDEPPPRPCLSDLARWLAEPLGSALRARIVPLRQMALRLEEKNRLAASVARNLHEHLGAVLASVAQAGRESPVYGTGGTLRSFDGRTWVDAVG